MSEYQHLEQTRERLEETSGEGGKQTFEDGLTLRTVVGSLFVGFIMMPGAMYLGMVAGQGLGPAAQWVTVVLFSEIARRSFRPLKRQEIYMLLYLTGGIVGAGAAGGLTGGPFANLVWGQYLVQCPQLGNLVRVVPPWIAPQANSAAIIHRTFMSMVWIVPISLIVINEILSRMIWIGGGYALFRVTSDVERLPFPMAPIAAAGATALAEAGDKQESWRWQVFSTGAVVGMLFGVIYVFIPIVTGCWYSTPTQLIPIPFIDFTKNTERLMPAAWSAISGDLANVFIGFVIPFQILLGSFISSVVCKLGLNPVLYHLGYLPHWRYGTPYLQTEVATNIDFWMSVTIGTALGIAAIGLSGVFVMMARLRAQAYRPTMQRALPPGRGDWSLAISLAVWAIATCCQVLVCHILVPKFPWWIMVFYGLIYTPLISYTSGRLIGLTGQGIQLPYLREATIVKSGYTRPDVWFVGMPMYDLGSQAQFFRELELTGNKFTSIIKAEGIKLLVILPASFLFWSFFWKTSAIPSAQFPYIQRYWPVNASLQSVWWTANSGHTGDNWLLAALRPAVIGYAGIGTIIAYVLAVSVFKVPLLFFYGLVGGIGAAPLATIPQFGGSLLGRYYFRKRFGAVRWAQYAPVLVAGFGCGTGLAGMTGCAIALITKSVNHLPF